MRTLLTMAGILVASAIASAQTTGTLTGKIVDVATYVTKDHNMDSMMKSGHATSAGHGMSSSKGDMMSGDHAMRGMKEACHMLGLLANGRITLLAPQMGSSTGSKMCGSLNKAVTVTGRSYTQAGTAVFLVDTIK